MRNLLYFDPFNGVSGDMILGALVDLGLPLDHLNADLAKLELEPFEISCNQIERRGLRGINLHVDVRREKDHTERGRHLGEISRIIETSTLDSWTKEKAVAIFNSLGEAEAKVHGCSLEQVHFHEVGAVDAIVDIVGACIGFRYFQIDHFYTAPLHLGDGTVTFSHGTWPVPAPATAELIQGFPVVLGEMEGELTTADRCRHRDNPSKGKRTFSRLPCEQKRVWRGRQRSSGNPQYAKIISGTAS